MGKANGYLEIGRVENPLRAENVRSLDFADLHGALSEGERRAQASRCMNCGVPYCQSEFGCPLKNLIPEWNDLIYRGDDRAALYRLLKTSSFPEFTGRVCPALCEKACMMAETDGATTTRDNELYLIEKGFANGWVEPRIPEHRSGKRIAVVGSGPAGMACADRLNRLSHSVTVYERADRPGGLLMYGIPNMKLPKEIVARRIRLMQEEGVAFITGTEATPDVVREYDAVVLCGGARKPRALNVPGENAEGVHFAVDYLTEATRALLKKREAKITAKNKNVIVVGGGDTGNDCVGTAIRQGCKSLIELEMLPAAPNRRTPGNPWPEWPRTLRTDYGQLEAAHRFGGDPRLFETTVCEVLTDEDGKICAVRVANTMRDASGRWVPAPGTERELPCDLLLIAAGFVGADPATAQAFGLELGPRGTPKADAHRIADKLFTAGDMRGGQSLVVRAIADGRAAADEVNAWLKKG